MGGVLNHHSKAELKNQDSNTGILSPKPTIFGSSMMDA